MENQLMQTLPAEVAQIAEKVSIEKRNEVQVVLNHVFNGVSRMREQLESIVVKDQNDEVSMRLARTVRLAVRQVRLDAEKIFDAKRAEVQNLMLSCQLCIEANYKNGKLHGLYRRYGNDGELLEVAYYVNGNNVS